VVFHAILELDPPSPLPLNPTLPPKLHEIIEKLLEKDRDLRYQSAADLRGALERLKRDVESGRKTTAASGSASVPTPGSSGSGSGSAVPIAAGSGSSQATTSQSSAVVAAAGRHKVGTGVSVLLGLVVMLAAGYGVYSLLTGHAIMPFRNFSVTRVTEEGNVVWAALSPDGKYILSLVRDNGLASLLLRNVPTNSITQVQPPAELYCHGVRFSPDGDYFYFARSDPGSPNLQFLYRAPLRVALLKNWRRTWIRISRSVPTDARSPFCGTTILSRASIS
jgi:hypothetical protein